MAWAWWLEPAPGHVYVAIWDELVWKLKLIPSVARVCSTMQEQDDLFTPTVSHERDGVFSKGVSMASTERERERLVHGVLPNDKTCKAIRKRQNSGKWRRRSAFSAIQEITDARDGTRGEFSSQRLYSYYIQYRMNRTTECPQRRKLNPSFITKILF